jgi:hypothetical protein
MKTFTVFILISVLARCSYEPKYPKVLAYLREILLMMKAPKCEYLMT